MTTPLHPTLAAVTARIEQRSARTRQAYLDVLAQAKKPGPYRGGMGCANAAHAYAAMPANDKLVLRQERQPITARIAKKREKRPAICRKAGCIRGDWHRH